MINFYVRKVLNGMDIEKVPMLWREKVREEIAKIEAENVEEKEEA